MNLSLKNKNALVCGSTQGIGKAAAIELALLGANVTLVARNEKELSRVVKELPVGENQTHQFIAADFNFPDELKLKIENHVQHTHPIHILINNTGGPSAGLVSNAKSDEFLKAFNNHLVCNHILAQACLDGMKEAKYGRIINIISTSVKQPIKGLGVSNTIRAAVANWSKTLAGEVAKFGITVNNILPGATSTIRLKQIIEDKSKKSGKSIEDISKEMTEEIPAMRFADASEIGSAIAFLASPAASYITGINLPVDGGRTASL